MCSKAVWHAKNSDPYVAVSVVFCFFEYQSIGVLFQKCKKPVTDLPVSIVVSWTDSPNGLGALRGNCSEGLPYGVYFQSIGGMSGVVGKSGFSVW